MRKYRIFVLKFVLAGQVFAHLNQNRLTKVKSPPIVRILDNKTGERSALVVALFLENIVRMAISRVFVKKKGRQKPPFLSITLD
jgi:hypothetical protein